MFAPDGIYTSGLANDGGGEHIDPVATDLLATTGPQPAGTYLAVVTITAHSLDASVGLFRIQHRDSADNDVALESVVVAVPVDDCRQFSVLFKIETDERIAVVPYGDLIGTVMAAINWQHLA